MISGGADVIVIEIKSTISVMCLNYPKTILLTPPPPTLVHGKIVFHKTGPSWVPVYVGACVGFTLVRWKLPEGFEKRNDVTYVSKGNYGCLCRKRSQSPVSSGGCCSSWVRGHGDSGQRGYDADDEKRADSRDVSVHVCIYVLHTKQFTEIHRAVHSFKVYNSRAFSIGKDLCSHHHYWF